MMTNILPHQQRVIDEKNSLDEKARALSRFIGYSPLFEKIDDQEKERMKEQNDVMWQYSEILGKRIEAFLRPNFEAKVGGENILADFRRNADGTYSNPHAEQEWKDFVATNANYCPIVES